MTSGTTSKGLGNAGARRPRAVASPSDAPRKISFVQAVAKPRWSTASYLVYAGAFVVLGVTAASLAYLSTGYGSGALAGWALLMFVVLLVLALALRRQGRQLAAGLFAFVAVDAFGLLTGTLWSWWGWFSDSSSGSNLSSASLGGVTGGPIVGFASSSSSSSSPFSGFDLGTLSFELVILIAALAALRTFRHPLLVWGVLGTTWLLLTDVISNGGNWTAVVTLLIGLVYLAIGKSLDGGPRDPYGFWFHLMAGLLVGGTLLFWWHSGDFHWALICVGALVYVALAYGTRRSSWAVFGSVGLFAAAVHFSVEWVRASFSLSDGPSVGSIRVWVPLVVFAFHGFLLVTLGLARREPAADAS